MSPFVLRLVASVGAVAAFVAGIAGQALRGHTPAGQGTNPSAAVRAAISDTGTVPATSAARLRSVALPSLAAAPRRVKHHLAAPTPAPTATPATTLVSATPTPAPTPAAVSTPAPVVRAPVVAHPPKPAPKPSTPARGPSFDSSG